MDFKNISYEDVEALFISPHYQQIVSPYRIKRIQKGNDRYYATMVDGNMVNFYLSVTSFASKSLNNYHLAQWRGNLGNELADYKAKISAEYGTFLHIQIGEYLKNNKFNFDELDDLVYDYLLGGSLDIRLAVEWIDKAHKDMLAFMQFAIDKNLEVIALEFPIVSNKYKLGGCIDLVAKADFNKGRPTCVIDFKSGRKGFYEAHELQLKCYANFWNEHYSTIMPVSHIFNWSPCDWRTTPSYKFKNQTKSTVAHKLLMERALAEGWVKNPKPIVRGKGIVEFGQDSISEHINIVELSDYYKAKSKK